MGVNNVSQTKRGVELFGIPSTCAGILFMGLSKRLWGVGVIKTHLHSNNNVKSHETPLFIATETVGCLAWPKYKQKYSLDMD